MKRNIKLKKKNVSKEQDYKVKEKECEQGTRISKSQGKRM